MNMITSSRPGSFCVSSGMEQENIEAKQQGGDASEISQNQKGVAEKGDAEAAEVSNRAEKGDAEKLIAFMEDHYDDVVARVQSFDEFYHAIFELIEMFCEERGQLQYRIAEKKTLEDAYNKHHRSDGNVTKEEFDAMSREVVTGGSFRVGKASVELGMLLFGAPACALLAKRILPGLGWLSDDVVVPLATSGSVAYLIKSRGCERALFHLAVRRHKAVDGETNNWKDMCEYCAHVMDPFIVADLIETNKEPDA